jgi:uncharacterized membrane protein YedE/YeeE
MNRQIAYYAVAILSGFLFGAGLYISQMVDPYKVLNFLDFGAIPSGGWDPSLAFVMGGGLVVMFIAVRFAARRGTPILDSRFHVPEYNRIDTPLIAGSALFGIGWGMSGICPGPAISLIAFLPDNLWVFLVAMFAGSFLGNLVMRRWPRAVPA